jgi:hypothetical protein
VALRLALHPLGLARDALQSLPVSAPICPLDHTPLIRDEDGALVCHQGHEFEDYPVVSLTCETCCTHAELEDLALGSPATQVVCMGGGPDHGRPVARFAVRACHSSRRAPDREAG